jgi:hypothetical protein
MSITKKRKFELKLPEVQHDSTESQIYNNLLGLERRIDNYISSKKYKLKINSKLPMVIIF